MSIDTNKLKMIFPNASQEDIKLLVEYFLESETPSPREKDVNPRVIEIFQKLKKAENEKEFDGKGFAELKAAYGHWGLSVDEPKEPPRFGETLVVAPYDGVNYAMDDHGKFLKSGNNEWVLQGIKLREFIIDNYHDVVKGVYEYCVALEVGYIWVMVSNGQVFIGNHTGYLAILYLDDFDPEEEFPDYDHNGNLAHCLSVNFKYNNIYFENKFKMNKICLRLSE